MSVLIKGVEMPKNCNECPMYFYEGQGICSCRVLSAIEDDEVLKPWKKKRKDCPLISVPPHGRLIDADEMFIEFVIEGQRSERYKIGEKWELNGEEIRGVISRLPTIIPAEEGE